MRKVRKIAHQTLKRLISGVAFPTQPLIFIRRKGKFLEPQILKTLYFNVLGVSSDVLDWMIINHNVTSSQILRTRSCCLVQFLKPVHSTFSSGSIARKEGV